jgi:hypothetical protein
VQRQAKTLSPMTPAGGLLLSGLVSRCCGMPRDVILNIAGELNASIVRSRTDRREARGLVVLPGDVRGSAGVVARLETRVVPEALADGRRLVPLVHPLVCAQPTGKLFVCMGIS